jgi:NRAMP (natural resistance-associated macrophage protein)-like metal ion transporter
MRVFPSMNVTGRSYCRLKYMAIAAGMVGALVMPHNIFLHSALVQSREIDLTSTSAKREAIMYHSIESAFSLGITVVINLCLMAVFASGFHGRAELGITEVGLGSAGKCALLPCLLVLTPLISTTGWKLERKSRRVNLRTLSIVHHDASAELAISCR